MKHRNTLRLLLATVLLLALAGSAAGLGLNLNPGAPRLIPKPPINTPEIVPVTPQIPVPPTPEPPGPTRYWRTDLNPADRNIPAIIEALKNIKKEIKIDWEGLAFLYHGYVNAPDSGSAAVYDAPWDGSATVGSLPHRKILSCFAYLPNYPGWYIITGYLEGIPNTTGVFIRAENVLVPHDEFAEEIKEVEWYEGDVVKVEGGVPVYDGPGHNYPIIHHFTEGYLNGGGYWPSDPNWVLINSPVLWGLGYGNGRGFIEAKYYNETDIPAK